MRNGLREQHVFHSGAMDAEISPQTAHIPGLDISMWSASLFRESGSTWVCCDSPTAFGGSRAYNRSSSSSHILSLSLSLFLLNRRSVLSHCLHFLHFLHLLHSLLCQRRGALYCIRHTILLSPHLAQNTRSPQWLLRMPKLRQQT